MLGRTPDQANQLTSGAGALLLPRERMASVREATPHASPLKKRRCGAPPRMAKQYADLLGIAYAGGSSPRASTTWSRLPWTSAATLSHRLLGAAQASDFVDSATPPTLPFALVTCNRRSLPCCEHADRDLHQLEPRWSLHLRIYGATVESRSRVGNPRYMLEDLA